MFGAKKDITTAETVGELRAMLRGSSADVRIINSKGDRVTIYFSDCHLGRFLVVRDDPRKAITDREAASVIESGPTADATIGALCP